MMESYYRENVLDHGFIDLVDYLGTDLTVVNSARVSYGKRRTSVGDDDVKLIHYLAAHKHFSPFRHLQVQFHCKVPEFVARQWYKHVVGITYSEGAPAVDHAWNEISMRYVEADKFDYYIPKEFRGQSTENKQASAGEIEKQHDAMDLYQKAVLSAAACYNVLRELGVSKEQARGVLPLTIYTEFYWTASLQAVANFIKLRQHKGAQWEIQQYAQALHRAVQPLFPHSMEALLASE